MSDGNYLRPLRLLVVCVGALWIQASNAGDDLRAHNPRATTVSLELGADRPLPLDYMNRRYVTPFVDAPTMRDSTYFAQSWPEWLFWSERDRSGFAPSGHLFFTDDHFFPRPPPPFDIKLSVIRAAPGAPLLALPNAAGSTEQDKLRDEIYRLGDFLAEMESLPLPAISDPTSAYCRSETATHLNWFLRMVEEEAKPPNSADTKLEPFKSVVDRVVARAPRAKYVIDNAASFETFLFEQCAAASSKMKWIRDFSFIENFSVTRHRGEMIYIPLVLLQASWSGSDGKLRLAVPPDMDAAGFLHRVSDIVRYLRFVLDTGLIDAFDEAALRSMDQIAGREPDNTTDSLTFWLGELEQLEATTKIEAFREQVWDQFADSVNLYRFFGENQVIIDLSLSLSDLEILPVTAPIDSTAAMSTVQIFANNQTRGRTSVSNALGEYLARAFDADGNMAAMLGIKQEDEGTVIPGVYGASLFLGNADREDVLAGAFCVASQLHPVPARIQRILAAVGLRHAFWRFAHLPFNTAHIAVSWDDSLQPGACGTAIDFDGVDKVPESMVAVRKSSFSVSEADSALLEVEATAAKRMAETKGEFAALFSAQPAPYIEFAQASTRVDNIERKFLAGLDEVVQRLQGQLKVKTQTLRKLQISQAVDAVRSDSILRPIDTVYDGNPRREGRRSKVVAADIGLIMLDVDPSDAAALPVSGFARIYAEIDGHEVCVIDTIISGDRCPPIPMLRSDPVGAQLAANFGEAVVQSLIAEFDSKKFEDSAREHIYKEALETSGAGFSDRLSKALAALEAVLGYDSVHVVYAVP